MAIYFLEDSKIDCTGDRNQASLCNFGLYDYLIDRERFIKKGTDILKSKLWMLNHGTRLLLHDYSHDLPKLRKKGPIFESQPRLDKYFTSLEKL